MNRILNVERSLDGRVYEIDSSFINAVLKAVENNSHTDLSELFEPLHPADIADVLEQVPSSVRVDILVLWGDKINGEVFAEMDDRLCSDLIEALPDKIISAAVRKLESDDVVDLLEDMEEAQKERLLNALEDRNRIAIRQSLLYPEGTAGRLMQRELVMAPTHWTVGDAIDSFRKDKSLPDRFYDIVITDPKFCPIGKVPLDRLLLSPRKTILTDLMDEEFRTIPVHQSQEDVAYAFNQYNMISAPVVDEKNRFVGVITIDDAMEVLEEEAEEDIKLLAGVGDENLTDSIFNTTRLRFPWLSVNLVTSVLASIVIAQFSDTIEAIVALAILMPIVASMGGNAGTQTLTIAVRALATKDLTQSNALRVIRRELFVGLLNGVIFAVLIGIIGMIWFGSALLGLVLALAMLVNLLVAGIAGIMVPLSLDRLGIDPALASSAFVTTVTDVIGFFVFLGLATTILL